MCLMKTFILLVLLFTAVTIQATETAHIGPVKSSPNAVGHSFIVELPGLERKMKFNLWIPEGKHETELPLLVVLDGQRYFNYATSLHHLTQQYGWAPKFAVLGIDTSERRWPTLMGQRQAMLQALKEKVFPYLEQHHQVSKERILFGWEAAGGFALRTLMDEPELFSGYIVASPSPLFGDYFPTLRDDHLAMVKSIKAHAKDTQLYVATGRYDYPQQHGVDELSKAIKSLPTTKLRQTFIKIEDATHASLGFEVLLKGMRDYFYYYDKPEFKDVDAFYKQGGITYLDNYFKIQAQKFGFDEEQIAKNRFEALRKLSLMMVMDDDVEQLKAFLKQQGDDFLTRSHLNHIYIYGKSMLKHNQLNDAEEIFNYLRIRHPEHARPINGLGLLAKLRGKEEDARELFKKAVEIGTKSNDFRLPEYQQNLSANLTKK